MDLANETLELREALVSWPTLLDVSRGVKLWCRGQRYWTCIVEGDVSVDLTGAIAGVVTATEAEYGASQERIRLARRRGQIANLLEAVERQDGLQSSNYIGHKEHDRSECESKERAQIAEQQRSAHSAALDVRLSYHVDPEARAHHG